MTRRGIILGLLGVMAAHSTHGADSACLKIEVPLDRLACYDRESGRLPVVTQEAVPEKVKWDVQTSVSKLSDKKQVFLSVKANQTVNCSWGRDSQVYLVMRCMEDKTAIYVMSECHVTASRYNTYGHVDYRIDDKPAGVAKMENSTDNKSLGLWTGAKAIPLIKQMLGGKKMYVQFTPYGDNAVSAEFDIAGLDEVIKPMRDECKW